MPAQLYYYIILNRLTKLPSISFNAAKLRISVTRENGYNTLELGLKLNVCQSRYETTRNKMAILPEKLFLAILGVV